MTKEELLELKLKEIIKGKNESFQKEFGKNQNKAIRLLKKIIKKEVGSFSGEQISKNKRLLSFILAFDTENGLNEFIEEKYFSYEDLYYDTWFLIPLSFLKLSLKTIYQYEEIVGNVNKKFIKISPWIKLLKYGNTHKKIENIKHCSHDGKVIVTLPKNMEILHGVDYSKNFPYERKIAEILKIADNVVFNKNLQVIGEDAFKNCNNIKKVQLPNSLVTIRYRAFSCCTNLKEIIFNEGLVGIDTCSFENCKSIEKMQFPQSLIYIGNMAFFECENLVEIIFNEGLKEIGWRAFSGCRSIKNLQFSKTLRRIRERAFEHCINLEEIIINEGLELIFENAFENCVSLKHISVPSHKIEIKKNIFAKEIVKQINIIVRGLEIENGCLEGYLESGINQIKSVELMDGDIVAVHYEINSNDINKMVNEIMQLLEDYKVKCNNNSNENMINYNEENIANVRKNIVKKNITEKDEKVWGMIENPGIPCDVKITEESRKILAKSLFK